jgi:hypothetical protein
MGVDGIAYSLGSMIAGATSTGKASAVKYAMKRN